MLYFLDRQFGNILNLLLLSPKFRQKTIYNYNFKKSTSNFFFIDSYNNNKV